MDFPFIEKAYERALASRVLGRHCAHLRAARACEQRDHRQICDLACDTVSFSRIDPTGGIEPREERDRFASGPRSGIPGRSVLCAAVRSEPQTNETVVTDQPCEHSPACSFSFLRTNENTEILHGADS